MAALDLPEPEMFWTRSFDGTRIQGWILKPPGFDPSKQYPLILQIHGGPHAAYGATFTHEFLWMAAKGYVVVYTNPRGSTTYGQQFGNSIQHRYPGDDYRDLMAALDDVVGRGFVDRGAPGRHRWQRRRAADQLGAHQDDALCGRRVAAVDRGLGSVVVLRRLHAVHAQLVQGPAVAGAEGLRGAARPSTHVDKITTPLMLIDGDAGLPHAAGGRRRGDVPRAEVPQGARW